MLSDEEFTALVHAGKSISEIAEISAARGGPASYSSAAHRKKALGLSTKQVRTKGTWFPHWGTVEEKHSDSGPMQNLYILSRVAQGEGARETKERINTAIPWAADLVAKGLDVEYDPSKAGSDHDALAWTGGFYTVERATEESSLAKLYTAALVAIKKETKD
ncbi:MULTISPECIES: hypothetical protein [Streptomyces]